MEMPRNAGFAKSIGIGASVAFCLLYLVLAARLFVASVLAERADSASLQRAVHLDPGNADYRDRLGRYHALVERDPSSAIEHYRAAVALNTHSARYWFDLASAHQVLGNIVQQTSALERAIAAEPTTPDVAWEAANFYLVQGADEKALHEFRVVLEDEPSLAGAAIRYCWRVRPDVDSLLATVVPQKAEAYIAFLDLLMAKQETKASEKVWAALISTAEPFELREVYDYSQFLIKHQDVDEARLVWQQAAPRFGLSSYLPTRNNLIVNGDFHLDVLNGGFDWQYEKQQSVTLALDPSEFHGGHRSLLITFDGPGVSDAGIHQFIAVEPNTTYAFSAYYKNGEIEGAGGPRFTIEDAYKQTVLYDSEDLTEAGFWKSASAEFTTPSDCTLLSLRIRRVPEGSPMRGKLWVDDFRLSPKPQ
jgi:tetratricopeptide (TPR) repeat protein